MLKNISKVTAGVPFNVTHYKKDVIGHKTIQGRFTRMLALLKSFRCKKHWIRWACFHLSR